MKTLTAFVLLIALILPFIIGIYWVMWQFWLWLVPLIWSTAPSSIANPSFWVFVAWLFVLKFLGSFFRK